MSGSVNVPLGALRSFSSCFHHLEIWASVIFSACASRESMPVLLAAETRFFLRGVGDVTSSASAGA